ncbi:choice-of-anchor tandem repeat GloVer-containing protein [Flavobacterium sp. 25HG05S-40]|uniref:choice-of-anchor tandem repeat GloVer-containing protein n=1 Tax=Flavobacterium sp. 25HG05S-40 TaxID=3458682 RepID=UPI004044ED14
MKKINTLLLFFTMCFFNTYAQKELWGTTRQPSLAQVQGNIVKFDINGENAVTVHQFNFPTGKVPIGKLFLASNGKLYGTATYGGVNNDPTFLESGNGVLYEYDLTFDTYRVVHYFNYSAPTNIATNPTSGLIEPIPGKLYGGTLYGSFYVCDIATETVTTLTHTYSFAAMGGIYSDLIKASNGFVYAISDNSFPCTGGIDPQPNMGTVIKINTATNIAQKVASFACVGTDGEGSNGILIEALPNRIFFTSGAGYQWLPVEGFSYPAGTIVEFNTLTNTLTRKITFDVFNSLGFRPTSFVLGNNGNLYGTCENGGDTYRSPFTSGVLYKAGTIFEYNPNNNSLAKLADFMPFRNLPNNIIKLSTGEFAGNLGGTGLFKFNSTTNSLQFPDALTYSDFGNQASTQNLVEICRKPSYHFFDVTTFDGCVGGTFTYDIQNTNATSYQWQKGNQDVAGQTTGILNLTNLTASDAGTYTCVMTNECGTTTTMALNLTVNCLGTNIVAQLDKAIKLYPNPTQNTLNIKLPENIAITVNSLKIANTLGQIIVEQKAVEIDTIDVSHLQSGIYIMALTTNYGNWNGRFIKE